METIVQLAGIIAVVALCALLKFKTMVLVIPGLRLEINRERQ